MFRNRQSAVLIVGAASFPVLCHRLTKQMTHDPGSAVIDGRYTEVTQS